MKFKKYIVLVAGLSLLHVSCNKYLEVDPDNRAKLNSPAALRELLATAYPQASYVIMAESMSDNFSDKGIFASSVVNPINRDVYLYRENIQSNAEDSPDYYWAACYKAIAAANQALKYIDEQGSPADMKAYKGEALLCRAYAHFMLSVFFARTYGDANPETTPGIPYVTEVEDVVIKKYSRGTVKSLYDNIQSDLEAGLPLINDEAITNLEATAYHFNTRAALAFATRFYMFKKDYQSVIKYAKKLLPNPTIISNTLRDIVAYKPLPYYGLQQKYTSISEPANLLLATSPSKVADYPYFRFGANGAFTTAFMWKEPPVSGASYAWNLYGQDNLYNIPKYRPYENQSVNYIVNVLFSVEEVLFNWAEASIMTQDYDNALSLFNLYLKKKLVSSSNFPISDLTDNQLKTAFSTSTNDAKQDYYIAAALDFKRREYAFEGIRWLDMIRHRIPVVHNTSESSNDIVVGANDPRRILQIPLEVQMSGVERNPR